MRFRFAPPKCNILKLQKFDSKRNLTDNYAKQKLDKTKSRIKFSISVVTTVSSVFSQFTRLCR